jgi:transcriptional regulator with XRE-family HTH domain
LHAENTFAKKETKIELAKQTNLSVNQVSKWLNDQRARRKKVVLKPIKNNNSSKKILRDYFENVTRTPTNLEIKNLKKLTGLSEKKINYWFNLKNRF